MNQARVAGRRFKDRAGCGLGRIRPDASSVRFARMFRPGYVTALVQDWLARARRGGSTCWRRPPPWPTSAAATAFSTIVSIGTGPFPRIDLRAGLRLPSPARSSAANRRMRRRMAVEAMSASRWAAPRDFPGTYGFVTCFDCLHDMGDPRRPSPPTSAKAAQARRQLDGVSEPNCG